MSVSIWRRAPAPAAIPCDALVIGGGICGIGAALALQRRALHTRLVERFTLASGASGRNAGFLMRGAHHSYAAARELHGRDTARLLWRWTEENLAALRAEGADRLPSFSPTPSCILALDPAQLDELHQSARLLREDGFLAQWIESGDDALWRSGRALGGLLNPGDATVDPCELLSMLAAKLQSIPHGSQHALDLLPEADHIRVRTTDAVFLARLVLVCTNAYAPLLLPVLAPLISPRRAQMLALHAPGVRLDFAYYANRGSEYFRRGPGDTLLFGGCRSRFEHAEVGYDEATSPDVQAAIEEFAHSILNRRHPVVARWAGTMGFTPDSLPLIGPVPGDWGDRLWFCGGFTGHGMSIAFRAAHAAVASMLDGRASPFPISRLAPGRTQNGGISRVASANPRA